MTSFAKPFLVALILAGIGTAALGSVVRHEFINYDDDLYLAKNPHLLDGLSWPGVRWAFAADLLYNSPHVDYWQPVTLLSRMADVELHGLNPSGHHATNLALHLLNGILLFDLLWGVTGAFYRSAFGAALFLIHPVQVEAVAWATARKDLLGLFFGLLAIRAYTGRRPLLMSFFFLLSLMSKPVFVTLPFVLLLLDSWPLNRPRLNLFGKKILFLMAAIFSVLPLMSQRGAFTHSSLVEILSNVPLRYLGDLGKFFYPVNLAIAIPLPMDRFAIWQVAGAAFLLMGVTAAVVWQGKRRGYLTLGWFWFLGTLVPVMGLLRHEDRFLYLPIIGLILISVWGGADLLEAARFKKPAIVLACGSSLALLAIGASHQASHWQTSITLFEHSLAVNPENYLAHNQLCAAWLDKADYEKAVRHCLEARRIHPGSDKVRYNLAMALAGKGEQAEAIAEYGEALRIHPEYAEAHSNLGVLLIKEGKIREAIRHFREAVRLRPDSAPAHLNLAQALVRQGNPEAAVSHYEEVLRLKPDTATVHQALALVLENLGRREEARSHFVTARTLEKKLGRSHGILQTA